MPQQDFKDRRTALAVVGVLYAGIGLLLLLPSIWIAFFMFLGPTEAGPDRMAVAPFALMWFASPVWFIWLGIGSILARRWARALILASSWFVLVTGVMGGVGMFAMFATAYRRSPFFEDAPMPVLPIILLMVVFFVALYTMLPGALVLFYGSRNVKRTVEFHDPHARWTDECPIPVLVGSIGALMWGVSMLTLLFSVNGPAFPFFGVFVTGWPAAVVNVVFLVACLYVAWGMCKLRMGAWLIALALFVFYGVSSAITLAVVPAMEAYAAMGISGEQLQLLSEMTVPTGRQQAFWAALWTLLASGYLLYIRRYFQAAADER